MKTLIKDLLEAYCGWGGSAELSKQEYDYLVKVKKTYSPDIVT